MKKPTLAKKRPQTKKTATTKSKTNPRLQMFNKHINFDREKEKGNARKWPTEVTCIRCKKRFILPFKPRNPEVYCDECFKNKRK
ncbi:hypothetical protein JXA48_02895 [Candidatus Woesearchaeota archaeon]|nr:hypothetical protein [Candidatus Woesearchaeota archaeon]